MTTIQQWVLILSLFSTYSDGGKSIDHVAGFENKEACVMAGQAWVKTIRENVRSSDSRALALCVRVQ